MITAGSKRRGMIRRIVLPLLLFAVLLTAGTAMFRAVGTASGAAETELVRDAVRQAALTCYAVEGAYPSGLDYLQQHYGLVFDEEAYIVVYDAFASNVMPDVLVLERGSGWR